MFKLKTILNGRRKVAAILGAFACAMTLAFAGPASAETPDETYKALGLAKSASPKELYEALTKRYHDEAQGAGKGSLAKYWEPIPISKYLNPQSFYKPPQTVDVDASRAQCVECHQQTTPGWTHSWQKSVHGNLDEIRKLPDSDSRAYKKAMIKEVEDNLRSMGTLKAGENLKEVGCIDCHMGVGKDHGQHKAELKMPDAAACGQCHVQQFAERESERDTFTWPQGQWNPGHPSHALSYKANVENAIWAAMEQREVAEGCTFCHTPQTTCNSCHTRHEFSSVEARKPQACAQCHNGVDHNEFENYMLSKHGTVYQTRGDSWDWNARLADAMEKGNMNAPTCQFCHMEYEGKFTHNMVRKSRWAFLPMPKIADNLNHPWFVKRKESWVSTCSNCHSDSFARAYLDDMDKGVISGINITEQARSVLVKLYNDKLLPGQTTNRPAPPPTEKDEPGAFFQLFWQKGNNPTAVEYEFAEMWEHHQIKHYKALAHMNPGGYTYSDGWSQLIKSAAKINDEDTRLREAAEIRAELKRISGQKRGDLYDLDSPARRAWAAGLGGLAVLIGAGLLFLRDRKKA
ncbi:multiheme c-type cytochrome [Methylocystis sp. ATCC 49242]|uniref:multiheme c-type cytochrome n=1 Tax=Methylocystis sp. ATCC 49242 TaxID=622637 RepID=UPI0001F87C8C|nr:multiheme c-type cytochrome [Methylocystis sp. ATCC 49242]